MTIRVTHDARTPTRTDTHARTLTHARARAHAQAHTHSLSLSPSSLCPLSLSCSFISHALSFTHTHTHTHRFVVNKILDAVHTHLRNMHNLPADILPQFCAIPELVEILSHCLNTPHTPPLPIAIVIVFVRGLYTAVAEVFVVVGQGFLIE